MSNFSPGEVCVVVGGPFYRGHWTRIGDEVTVVQDLGMHEDANGNGPDARAYHVDSPRIRDLLAQQSHFAGVMLLEYWLRRRDPPDKQDWMKLCDLAPREVVFAAEDLPLGIRRAVGS